MTPSSQYPFNFRQSFTSIWAVLILLIQLNSPNPKCICGSDLSFHPNSILRSYKHTVSSTPVPMWKQHWKCYPSLSDLITMLLSLAMARAAFVAAAVALGLQLLSLVGGVGGWWSPASGGAQAPHSTGFSHCRAQAPGARVSVTGAHRLSGCRAQTQKLWCRG